MPSGWGTALAAIPEKGSGMHQGFEEGGPEGAGASQSFIVVPRSLELKQALISYRAIYGVRKLARGCLSLLLMAGLFASYLPANQGNLSGSYTATTRSLNLDLGDGSKQLNKINDIVNMYQGLQFILGYYKVMATQSAARQDNNTSYLLLSENTRAMALQLWCSVETWCEVDVGAIDGVTTPCLKKEDIPQDPKWLSWDKDGNQTFHKKSWFTSFYSSGYVINLYNSSTETPADLLNNIDELLASPTLAWWGKHAVQCDGIVYAHAAADLYRAVVVTGQITARRLPESGRYMYKNTVYATSGFQCASVLPLLTTQDARYWVIWFFWVLLALDYLHHIISIIEEVRLHRAMRGTVGPMLRSLRFWLPVLACVFILVALSSIVLTISILPYAFNAVWQGHNQPLHMKFDDSLVFFSSVPDPMAAFIVTIGFGFLTETVCLLLYISCHPGLGIFSSLLGRAAQPLKDSILVILTLVLAITSCTYINWGFFGASADFQTWGITLISMLRLTLGFLDFEQFVEGGAGWGVAGFGFLAVFVFFLVAVTLVIIAQNVILAIVASAYEEAKDLQMEQLASPHTVALAVRMPFFQFVGSVIGFYARCWYYRIFKHMSDRAIHRYFQDPTKDFSPAHRQFSVSLLPEMYTLYAFYKDPVNTHVRDALGPSSEEEAQRWELEFPFLAQDGMSKDRLDRLLELVPVHMPRMTEMRSLVFRRPLHVWRSGEKEGDKDVVQELSASLWENFALEQQSQSAAVLARIMSPTWLIGTWLPVLPGNKNGQVKPLPGDAEDPAAKRTPSKLVKQDSIVGVLMSDNYLPNAQAQAKLRVHTSKLQQTLMMAVGTASIFGGMRKRRMQMEHMLKEAEAFKMRLGQVEDQMADLKKSVEQGNAMLAQLLAAQGISVPQAAPAGRKSQQADEH